MKYGAILIDPPWKFQTYSDKGRGRSPKYGVHAFKDLAEIGPENVAADDCGLFIWCIDTHVPEMLRLIDLWGFKFKTKAFVWVKPRIGLGYWSRKQSEICWLATKGKPKRLNADVREIIEAPTREHSRKPDEIYSRIERLVDGPYLEMFARQQWPGWDSWGNEVDKFTVGEA